MSAALAPAIDTMSIEHLDHRLECGFSHHVSATHWTKAHDCEETWMCSAHVRRYVELGARIMAKHGRITCAHCLTSFPSFEAYATVVPL